MRKVWNLGVVFYTRFFELGRYYLFQTLKCSKHTYKCKCYVTHQILWRCFCVQIAGIFWNIAYRGSDKVITMLDLTDFEVQLHLSLTYISKNGLEQM